MSEYFKDEDPDEDTVEWEPFLRTRRSTHITANTPFYMVMHNYYANATPTSVTDSDEDVDKVQDQHAPLHNIKLPTRRNEPRTVITSYHPIPPNRQINHHQADYSRNSINLDDDLDQLDKDMFSDQNAAGSHGLLRQWMDQCLFPFVTQDVSKNHIKLCSTMDESQSGGSESCHIHYFEDALITGRRRRAVCGFCGDFYSWLHGTVTTDDLASMLDAIKDDFKPTVTKINDALSQQHVMIDVLNKNWYASLKHSLQAQTLDLDLIKKFKIKDLIRDITTHLPKDLTIPPTWAKLSVYNSEIWKSILLEHHVGPSQSHNGQSEQGWLNIPGEQARQCWAQMGSVCDLNAIWNTINNRSCLPSLILHVETDQIGKECPVHLRRLYDDVAAVMVDKQHWLVSVLIDQIMMFQSCTSKGVLQSDNTEETLIRGMNLIQIPPYCDAQIGNIRLKGFQQLRSETRLDMGDNNAALSTINRNHDSVPVVVEAIKATLSISAKNIDADMLNLPHLNETLFQFGEVQYGDLRDKLSNLGDIKLFDITMLRAEKTLNEIIDRQFHWTDWNISHWIWTSLGCLILVILLAYCVKSRLLTPTQTTAGGFVGVPMNTLGHPLYYTPKAVSYLGKTTES
uniref:Uncharacterized protein n=1 Tax=Glossina austeni TaxID=7395 RepID=A0A1A9UN05_GLOAU